MIICKATTRGEDAYSAFGGTGLERCLKAAGVRRIFIGGLATDYCVLNTGKDAQALGYESWCLPMRCARSTCNPATASGRWRR